MAHGVDPTENCIQDVLHGHGLSRAEYARCAFCVRCKPCARCAWRALSTVCFSHVAHGAVRACGLGELGVLHLGTVRRLVRVVCLTAATCRHNLLRTLCCLFLSLTHSILSVLSVAVLRDFPLSVFSLSSLFQYNDLHTPRFTQWW